MWQEFVSHRSWNGRLGIAFETQPSDQLRTADVCLRLPHVNISTWHLKLPGLKLRPLVVPFPCPLLDLFPPQFPPFPVLSGPCAFLASALTLAACPCPGCVQPRRSTTYMPGLPFRSGSGPSLAAVFFLVLVLACNSLEYVEGWVRLSQCSTGTPLWLPRRLSTEFPIFTEQTLPCLLSLVNSTSGPHSEGHFPYTATPALP